jgi:hypothetical protein
VRVVGVARLDDGRIVVGNGASTQLKFFDRTGAYLSSFGGPGWDRGTFSVLTWIQLLETGEIVAFDASAPSLSVFTAEGVFLNRLLDGYDPRASGTFSGIVGVFDDKSVLLHQTRTTRESHDARRPDEWFVRVARGGLPTTVTNAFPGTEIVREHFINSNKIIRPPFGRALHVALSPDRFHVGDDDMYEISVFTPEGTLLHVIRLEGRERPATADDLDRYLEIRLPPNKDLPRDYLEKPLRALATHKTLPAFSALRADPDGNVWAREYDIELSKNRAERWNVFDANGRYLGDMTMPKGFEIMTVGTDYVAGVYKGGIGVETVRVYDLKKPRRR